MALHPFSALSCAGYHAGEVLDSGGEQKRSRLAWGISTRPMSKPPHLFDESTDITVHCWEIMCLGYGRSGGVGLSYTLT